MTGPLLQRLEGVRACVFDAYGTLFDFASAASRATDVPQDKRAALTALWRDKQLQYTWLRSLQSRYADFWQVTGEALDFALETLGLDASLREKLMDLYLELEPFPEVPGSSAPCAPAGSGPPFSPTGRPRCWTRWSPAPGSPTPSTRFFRSTRSASSRPIRSLINIRSTRYACRRPRSRSSPPTPGMLMRRRISACVWSGATVTASGASGFPGRRTSRSGRSPSCRGCWA